MNIRNGTLVAVALIANLALADTASNILRKTGVTGGFVVHVGCGTGTLTAALHANDALLVQGLDRSAENVARARAYISRAGLYGKVTAITFDGTHLPYRDNMVNLVVVTDGKSRVPEAEITRVLAPNGVAYVGGKQLRKPRPAEMDEWPMYHHDPQGTMVGRDTLVGPPHGIQWMALPKWLRNHDFMSSMHALVSLGGRIFYVIDEGLKNHIFLPSKWTLIARDAFNGKTLWKRRLGDWYHRNWPLKSGPGQFPRRLAAGGGKVFVTFDQTAPLTAIDSATGKTIRTYNGTKATEEVILADGVLYLLVNPHRKPVDYRAEKTSYKEIGHANNGWAWTPQEPPRSVVAVQPDTGRILWEHEAKVAPLTLTVAENKVFFATARGPVALDCKAGRQLWQSNGLAIKKVPTGGTMRAVYSDSVLLIAQGIRLAAFDAKDGKRLWANSLLHSSHHCPNDLFVIAGQIWSANTGRPQSKGTHLKVIDLHTGKVAKNFVAKNLSVFPMHPRCYPSRATTRYLITNGMGAEFYRVGSDNVEVFNYVRGSCIYGVMPCNGLLYKPPDSCACYYQSKLDYFCALSATPALRAQGEDRLERGPAYGQVPADDARVSELDWPMYRCDPARSGHCPCSISPNLGQRWAADLGGKLTQPVVVESRAFVSSIPQETLYALDAASGKVLWKYVAGGRIDSSPTVYKNAVLFGCGDGWVYCLRAKDGALAWRRRIAPADTQMLACERLDSVWPVHGSVLVVNDTLYALAGRNVFFDGGMRLVRLDPKTGRKISETILDDKDPKTGKNLQTLIVAKYMPIANSDILTSEGQRVFMEELSFDLQGRRVSVAPTLPRGRTPAPKSPRHLFCQTGLLDDAWFHRSYWIYGNDCGEGWGAYMVTRLLAPCGRIMVFDDKQVFAYRSKPLGNMLLPRTTYQLYAADRNPKESPAPDPPARAKGKRKRRRRIRRPRFSEHWDVPAPGLLVNAMVLSKGCLFIAGPPDLADETKMLGFLPGAEDEINLQLQAQNDAWLGKQGALLRAVSPRNGKKLSQYKLDNVPVFDGMAAAEGKLFISLKNGKVVCLGGK